MGETKDVYASIPATLSFECPADRQNLSTNTSGGVTCGTCGRSFSASFRVSGQTPVCVGCAKDPRVETSEDEHGGFQCGDCGSWGNPEPEAPAEPEPAKEPATSTEPAKGDEKPEIGGAPA